MAANLSPGNPIGPLSIGNVVSAGVRLYSSNLKTYLQLALIAHLWVIVPIYGWAKSAAISGLISRLAFGELINQPVSVSTARSQIEPRLWSFLMVSFQVVLRILGVYLGLAAVGGILAFVIGLTFGVVFGTAPATVLAIILIAGILIVGITWFYSRWVIAEVPLAVGEVANGSQSVDRSWELTKASVFRIQGVVLVAFAVTLPIVFLFNYLPQIFLTTLQRDSSIYSIVYAISWITSLVGGAFVMPFWQCIKAVLYYDLRTRREGFGLQLRNPTF